MPSTSAPMFFPRRSRSGPGSGVGRRTFKIGWLGKADPIAALLVSGVIVYVSWRLARKTIDALLDAASPGDRARVIDAVLKVNGVIEVERARSTPGW